MDDEKNLNTGNGIATPENAEPNMDTQVNQESKISLEKPMDTQSAPNTTEDESQETVVSEAIYVNNAPPSVPAPAPKKNNHGLIAGVAILAIIALVGIVAGPKLFGSPLTNVLSALNKTVENTVKVDTMFEQATGMGAAYEATMKGKSRFNAQLTLEEVSPTIDPENTAAGVGIYFQSDSDMENKLLFGDIGLTMDAAKLISMEVYANEETAAFAFPDFVSGYFSMPLKNIGAAYKESIFSEYQMLDIPDDYSLSLFEDTLADLSSDQNLINLSKKHSDWGKRFQKDVTVEKIDAVDLPSGESTISCEGYKIAMTPEKATAFLRDYMTFWETDEDAQAAVDEFITGYVSQDMYTTGMSVDELKQEMHSEFDEMTTTIKEMNIKNFALNCYIDENGLLRKAGYTATVTHLDDPTELIMEWDINLMGETRVADDVDVSFQASVDEETVSAKFYNMQSANGDVIATDGGLYFNAMDQDTIQTVWNIAYNTTDNTYSFDSELDIPDAGIMSLTSNGLLEIPQKGKSFKLSMDSIDILVDSVDEEVDLQFSGLLSLNELTEAVQQPTGTEYKVFELDEGKMQAIIFEAYGNLMNLSNEFSSIFQ